MPDKADVRRILTAKISGIIIVYTAKKKTECNVHRQPAPIPGDRALAVTIIGWHGTALACRWRGLQAAGPC